MLSAEPINQLLVTGGVLFFLQAIATVAFGVEFRNIGVRLPGVNIGDMNFSLARMIAFGVALAAIAATYLFLTRTYMGTAIRAISQDRTIMPLMGVNPSRIYLLTSFMGGALAVPHGFEEAVLTIIGVALVSLGHVLNLRNAH